MADNIINISVNKKSFSKCVDTTKYVILLIFVIGCGFLSFYHILNDKLLIGVSWLIVALLSFIAMLVFDIYIMITDNIKEGGK